MRSPPLRAGSATDTASTIGLWCLPQEIRELIYDYVLEDVHALSRYSNNVRTYVNPAIPVNQMLVNRRMYHELQCYWSSISSVEIVGSEVCCVKSLRLLEGASTTWNFVRRIQVSMTCEPVHSYLRRDLLPCRQPGHHDGSPLSWVLQSCRAIPRLRSLRIEVKTSGIVRDVSCLTVLTGGQSGLSACDESNPATFDKWYQVLRTEIKFTWTTSQDMKCFGTLIYLTAEKPRKPKEMAM